MNKIGFKRLGALSLLVMMLITQTVSFLPDYVYAAGATGEDRTLDSSEVAKNISLTAECSGDKVKISPIKSGNTTTFDMSSIAPDTISSIDFDLDFSVLKHPYGDDIRKLKGGDYIKYDFSEAGLTVGNIESKNVLAADGTVIASYQVKDSVFELVFSDECNAENSNDGIGGSVSLKLGLNLDKFSSSDKTVKKLFGDGTSDTCELIFGKLSTDVSGINIDGEFDPASTSIVWTIDCGTNSKGTNLNGADVSISFDESKLKMEKAYIMSGTEKIYVNLEGSDGKYTYRIKNEVTNENGESVSINTSAPFKLYVVTSVDSDALSSDFSSSEDSLAERTMDCELSQGDMSLLVDKENSSNQATSSVTLERPHISKSGEQISGNEMLWTLKVNDTDPKYVLLHSSITDEFTGMEYVDGSFTINGKTVSKDDSSNGSLVVESNDGSTKMVYSWPGEGRIDDVYTITYKTKIDTTGNYANKEVKNTVYMNGDWPTGGNGTGGHINYGMPTVTEEFQYVFLKESATVVKNSSDKANGLVEWTISPSSRDDNWDSAKITTKNEEDQVIVKNNSDYGIRLNYGSKVYTEDELIKNGYLTINEDQTLLFNLPHSEFEKLSDVKILYYTSVPSFFKTNSKEVSANGSSTLILDSKKAGSSDNLSISQKASCKLSDDLLSIKSERYYEKNSLNPEIKYTLNVNKNQIKIDKGSVVSTNLSELTSKLISDSNEIAIDPSEWKYVPSSIKVDGSKDVDCSYKDGNIVVDYLNDSSDNYTVSFRIEFSDSAREKYLLHSDIGGVGGNVICDTSSKITGNSSLSDIVRVVETEASDSTTVENPSINNAFLLKKSEVSESGVTWNIEINPNGTLLNGAKIIDVISKDLSLDYQNIKLYKATHEEGSLSLTKGEEVSFEKSLAPSDTGSLELSISLPDGNDAYILTYKTKLTNAVSSVSNTAKFINGNNKESSKNVAEISDSAKGFLSKVANFKLVKKDSISKKPIKNALFGLYSVNDDGVEMVSGPVFSDENGYVAFYGVSADAKNLYVRELKGTSDYVSYSEDENVYFVGKNTTKGMHDLTAQGGVILNSRNKVGTFSFKKSYENADSNKASEYESTFSLSILGDKEIPVFCVKQDDGSYKYATGKTEGIPGADNVYENAKDEDEASNIFSVKGENELKFTNLPWGDYVLREKSTKSGYSLSDDVKFSIAKDGSVTVNSPMVNNDGEFTLTNSQIKLNLCKKASSDISLDGCELAIYDNLDDATKGSDNGIVLDPRDNETKLIFKANDTLGTFSDSDESSSIARFTIPELSGPSGDATSKVYYLSEKKAPDDKRLCAVKPIKIVVDKKGSIKYGDSLKSVDSSREIEVVDNTFSSKFSNLDQMDSVISNSSFTLQKKDKDTYTDVASFTTTDVKDYSFDLLRDCEYRLIQTALDDHYVSYSDGKYISEDKFSTDKFGNIVSLDLGKKNSYDKSLNTFIIRNERIIGQAEFVKYTNKKNNGKYIPFKTGNARFELYTCDDLDKTNARNVVFEGKNVVIKSDSNGLVSTKSIDGFFLEKGFYFFREVETSNDYILTKDMDSDVFCVKASNRYTCDDNGVYSNPITVTRNNDLFINEAINASVVVKCIDSDGNLIKGASFSLNDDFSKTKEDGSISFSDLTVGTYTLKETSPSDGYKIDNTTHTISVNQDGTMSLDGKEIYRSEDHVVCPIEVTNEANSFTVTKKAEEGATNSLVGTKIALYNAKNPETPLKELQVLKDTKEGSVLRFNGLIKPVVNPLSDDSNTYVIKEVLPAHGYTLSNEIYVRMNYDGELFSSIDNKTYEKVENNNLDLINKQNFVSFKMVDKSSKYDLAGNNSDYSLSLTPVEGDSFSDKSRKAKVINIDEKDFKGILVPDNHYEVKEVKTPSGYITLKDSFSFTVDVNGVVSLDSKYDFVSVKDNVISIANEKSSLSVVKSGVSNHSVAGTTFEVEPVDSSFVDGSNQPISFVMEESDGGISGISDIYKGFEGMLRAGDIYKLTETVAADTYCAKEPIYLKIDHKGIVSTSETVDGEFTEAIYSVDGLGKNIIEIKNETNELTFTTFVNAFEYGKETDEPYAILPNATFTLYQTYEDGILKDPVKCKSTNSHGEVVSDKDGKITISGLKSGTYYLKETDVPIYDDDVNRVIKTETDDKTMIASFTVSKDGKVSSMKSLSGDASFTAYLNDTVRASFSMTKVDALDNEKVLPNSTYVLYRKAKDGAVADSYSTNFTKKAFMLKKNSLAKGIKLFNSKKYVPATALGASGVVSLLSRDEVNFDPSLYTEVMSVKTDKDGNINIDGLLTGYDYVLKEVVAPSGSQVSIEPISFTFDIDSDGVIKTSLVSGNGTVVKKSGNSNLNLLWKEPPTRVSVNKVDDGGHPVIGANLRILDENGSVVVKEWTTDGKPYILTGVLTAGKSYILEEISAPDGYSLSKMVKFTVKESSIGSSLDDINEAMTKVVMVDKRIIKSDRSKSNGDNFIQRIVKSPKTSDYLNWFIIFVLSGFIILSGYLIAVLTRDDNDK